LRVDEASMISNETYDQKNKIIFALSYFLLGTNFRVNNLIFDGIFFNFRISNLLNQKIIYPTDDQNKWANKGTFGNSRYFQATLGYKF